MSKKIRIQVQTLDATHEIRHYLRKPIVTLLGENKNFTCSCSASKIAWFGLTGQKVYCIASASSFHHAMYVPP